MATALHASEVAVTDNKAEAARSPRESAAPADFFAQSVASQSPEELASLLQAEVSDSVKPTTPCNRRAPWFAWPLLVASLVAFSSAAVVFASIPDVPTCTLAAWRLQLTTFLLTPAAVYQFLHLPAGALPNSLSFGCTSALQNTSMQIARTHKKKQTASSNSLQMTGSVCARTSC